VGLIVWGNFFTTSSHPVLFSWTVQPKLVVCDTVPDWAQPGTPAFKQAIAFWKDHGWEFSSIETAPCTEVCTVNVEEADDVEVTCNPGAVTLDLIDQWGGENHPGKCRKLKNVTLLGADDWSTILVPAVVEGSAEIDAPMLPKDANAIVLAHEIGHCLVGLDHNVGPGVGCANLNPKTGAVLNPSIYSAGWVDEGLPASPPAWSQP